MRGRLVLVVETDKITARFLSSLLREDGYEVLVAGDGEHAVQLAKDHPIDLVVGELALLYRDGLTVLEILQNEDKLARTPMMIVSVHDREEDIVQALEEGADDYLVKPFNARELLARMRKQLERPKIVR